MFPGKSIALVNMTHVETPLDPVEMTEKSLEGKVQADRAVAFLRGEYPAAFGNARIRSYGALGIRQTRWIAGRQQLTVEDVRAGRKFPDAVARTGWPIELHDTPQGHVWEPFGDDHLHYVPMGSLVSDECDNMVAAGRCIDGDVAALSSVRVMGPCIAMGAAAAHALDLAGAGSVHQIDSCGAARAREGQRGADGLADAYRRSLRSTASNIALAATAMTTSSKVSAMIILMLCSPIAWISRWPIPRCEANISPSSVPIKVSEKPMRMPVKISGIAAGSRTRARDARGVSRITRAALSVDRIEVAHRAEGEDRDRHDAVDRAECDLGRHADAEGQQHDRVERDLGDRIEPDQHRLGDIAGETIEAEREADQDAAGDRDAERDREGLRGLDQVRIERRRAEQLHRVTQWCRAAR